MMHTSVNIIVAFLLIIICDRRTLQLQEIENFRIASEINDDNYSSVSNNGKKNLLTEAALILSFVGLPVPLPIVVLGGDILKATFGDLISINNMPESVKSLFFEVLPFIHVVNRTENVTDVGITTKCCGRYGCFTTDYPFGASLCRESSLLPLCQDELKVKFYLWTRENPTQEDVIDPEDVNTLLNSHFLPNATVVMYIHGYLSKGNHSLVLEMKDAILKKTDCMFVAVDWMNGAYMNYTKSVANGQVVSAVTAYFIQQLMKHRNVSLDRIHIIGSSLGAHIAGGVGKRIPRIGRITGIDPAKPYFENCDSTVRLTKSDAQFVDVIHTDISMVGISTPSGHLDIYIQGGSSQPACFGFRGCDHPMSVVYFIDSINAECPYYAYQCGSFDEFMRGRCNAGYGPQNSIRARMGYHADDWKCNAKMSSTIMFMSARQVKPYCVYHYFVEIRCIDDRIRIWRYGKNPDKLKINLIGEYGETGLQYAHENSIEFTTSHHITTLITSNRQIGMIKSVKLKWMHYGSQELITDCNNITEPTCCSKDNYDCPQRFCFLCPFVVSSIYVNNLETSISGAFRGKNKHLQPFEEIVFDDNITCS